MRHPDDHHFCSLLQREVFWGDCWTVQDIRGDETDMEFAPEPFDVAEADRVCEKCRWCYVKEWD